MKKVALALLAMMMASLVYAHSGGTDKLGCHYDHRTGVYHCH
jgi:hypothetical protein